MDQDCHLCNILKGHFSCANWEVIIPMEFPQATYDQIKRKFSVQNTKSYSHFPHWKKCWGLGLDGTSFLSCYQHYAMHNVWDRNHNMYILVRSDERDIDGWLFWHLGEIQSTTSNDSHPSPNSPNPNPNPNYIPWQSEEYKSLFPLLLCISSLVDLFYVSSKNPRLNVPSHPFSSFSIPSKRQDLSPSPSQLHYIWALLRVLAISP
jgi:hypothetical protein